MTDKYRANKEVANNDSYAATSRYKNTRYFQRNIKGIGTRIEPESWNPPELEESDNDLITEVKPGEEGRLDLISLRVYRSEKLWWVIAFFNDIIDLFEVAVGTKLRCPPFNYVANKVLS